MSYCSYLPLWARWGKPSNLGLSVIFSHVGAIGDADQARTPILASDGLLRCPVAYSATALDSVARLTWDLWRFVWTYMTPASRGSGYRQYHGGHDCNMTLSRPSSCLSDISGNIDNDVWCAFVNRLVFSLPTYNYCNLYVFMRLWYYVTYENNYVFSYIVSVKNIIIPLVSKHF